MSFGVDKSGVIQSNKSVKLAAQTTIERQNKMAILKIVKYPEAVLERAGDVVTEFDDELKQLVNDMFETMYHAPGVGLAAPQVGVSKQVFVMDCSGGRDPQQKVAMINPQVLTVEGEYTAEEGCLSFPGIYFDVKRPLRAVVRAQDVDGKHFEVDGLELTARCMLHEKDHLDGVLFLQRTSPLKREMAKRRIRKLLKQGEW